jgi:hypothetical protein
MNAVRNSCIAAKATANARPRSANACGINEDSINPPSISANSISRTGTRSGSSQLVVQVVKIHSHHNARNINSVCTTPAGFRCSSRWCESWVTAKTNTRSKNSSTMATRPLSSRLRSRSSETV